MKLILIDGHAILHRAFHALPPLTKKGKMVNAIYGFFSMFLKILEDQKPDGIIVCFDMPKPNFRQSLYAGYQASRPKMSDDLAPQIEEVHDLLKKGKIEIFELEGYEADDLIGTLSVQAAKEGADVVIVSGDRDLLQLVNGHVKELMPITGLTNTAFFGEKEVEEKYGIKPSQFVDYKALIGDSSDNYPGVSGIGPKTAVQLVTTYGTIENMYANLDSINPKISQKLANDAEQAMLAKKLATIACDAPIHFDIEKCSMDEFDREGLKKGFEEYEMTSLVARLEGKAAPEKVQKVKKAEPKENPQLELI